MLSTIASDIAKEVKKATSIDYKWPANDSSEVLKWQSDFEDAYAKATQLDAVAKTLPGSPANGIPLMAGVDPNIEIAKINAKSTQAQAVLESAKNRLTTTQQAFLTTQTTYLESQKLLVEQENNLADIKSTLAKLNATNMSLAEIKVVLIGCIKLILSLKEQIISLTRCFGAFATIIDVTVKYYVDPFLETIKATVVADGTDPNQNLKIGDFTLTDLQRSNVYNSTLTIRSYFGVFGDVAGMWTQLSISSIDPGIALCDQISQSVDAGDKNATALKVKKLNDWTRAAQEEVKRIAKAKQREILSSMESRVEEIAGVTKLLPPLAPAIQKAIESVTGEVKDAAAKSLEVKKAASPFNRFGRGVSA